RMHWIVPPPEQFARLGVVGGQGAGLVFGRAADVSDAIGNNGGAGRVVAGIDSPEQFARGDVDRREVAGFAAHVGDAVEQGGNTRRATFGELVAPLLLAGVRLDADEESVRRACYGQAVGHGWREPDRSSVEPPAFLARGDVDRVEGVVPAERVDEITGDRRTFDERNGWLGSEGPA